MNGVSTLGIYSPNDLQKAISKNAHFQFVFFYHKGEKNGCLALRAPCEFKDNYGVKYYNLIQFTTAQKALLFNDQSSFQKVIQTTDTSQISKLAQQIQNFNREAWDNISWKFTFDGNLYKFLQNDKLFDFLLSFSPDSIFVNCDPNDPKYGIGLKPDDPQSQNPFEWKGYNLLGFQLTKVRDLFLKSTLNNRLISYAYSNNPDLKIKITNNVESIDLLSSEITQFKLSDNCYLKRLRISKNREITRFEINNMPNLEVVDLLHNQKLEKVHIRNCPNLKVLDISFCPKLKYVSEIPSLKYLSARNCEILNIKINSDQLLYLDITNSNINPIELLQKSKKIECFVGSKLRIYLSDLTKIQTIKIFHIYESTLICDSISSTQIKLQMIILDEGSKCEGNLNLLNYFYVSNGEENNHKKIPNFELNYPRYQVMLYGPWGIPKVDLYPPFTVLRPVIIPPSKINQKNAADSIFGSLFLTAVMDMSGCGTECMKKDTCKSLLLGNPNITWIQPRTTNHNKNFVRGTPTDDTYQCILIMRSIVSSNLNLSNSSTLIEIGDGIKIDPCDFGNRLLNWLKHGYSEHKDHKGLGVGGNTKKVISNKNFTKIPFKAAEEEWIKSNGNMCSNGCIMRIASSGCFAFWNENIVVKIAECFCKMTHFDPRCVFCAISSSLIISRFIQWNCGLLNSEPDINVALFDAIKYVPGIEKYKDSVTHFMNIKSIEDLNLSDKETRGFCLKTFGCAIWALRYCNSIEEAMYRIISQGGDTDTNAAVAGALLGAKFGFHSIPSDFIKCMFIGQWMYREILPFMQLMGIDVPDSPYLI